jgi:hypothetical protein
LSLTTEDSESSTSLRPIPKQQQQLYHPQRDKKEACKSQGEKERTRGPNNGYTSGKFLACSSAFLAFALSKGASPENQLCRCSLLLAGVILAVFLSGNGNGSGGGVEAGSNNHTMISPTSEPPIAMFDLFELLVDKSEGLRRSDSNGDMESPQYKAFSWLLELYGDQIQPVQEATVVETFALATLYHATNGTRWFNSDNWLSLTKPTCSWYLKGINCNNHN